ncbi:MAG: tRNA guanosine(34) transglycosylase Tgt [Bryobacterales bacterium]|nr:tRNA guanosine(34) transglycosylase Tgt [Bryobacterales bacterium]
MQWPARETWRKPALLPVLPVFFCLKQAASCDTETLEPALRFEIEATCPETGARTGRLHTPHGIIETPVFMPVGTQATVKGLTPEHLAGELDAKIILGNTYHLYLRPGHELIRQLGGLHRFMHWDRAILTDSGGFQVFSLDGLRKVREDGVLFRSHLNGDQHLFTPESTVDMQQALGSDIAMVLDECPPYPLEWHKARKSMELTVRWARRAFEHFRALPEDSRVNQALFPIVQGGMYHDLRLGCLEELAGLDAEGYAIGGLSVGEPRELSMEIADLCVPKLPVDKPRYVMGVGLPEELPQYVARGVDMMDCVMPSRNARNGCLFTSEGRVVIKQARFREDPLPVDPSCGCYTCKHFSRAYLRHLYLAGEMLFCTLATIHNLRYYLDIMRRIRKSILIGRFPEFLREFGARIPVN